MINIGFILCAKPQGKRDTSVRAKVVNRWTAGPFFGYTLLFIKTTKLLSYI